MTPRLAEALAAWRALTDEQRAQVGVPLDAKATNILEQGENFVFQHDIKTRDAWAAAHTVAAALLRAAAEPEAKCNTCGGSGVWCCGDAPACGHACPECRP